MATPKLTVRKVKLRNAWRWVVDLRSLHQGRLYFKKESDARERVDILSTEHESYGVEAFKLTDDDRREFLSAKHRLETAGATIRQATDYFLEHNKAEPKTIRDGITALIEAKKLAGKSKRYCQQLYYSVNSFADGRSDVLCSAVSNTDIEKWIHGQNWAAATKRTRLIDLRTFFSFALKRGWTKRDPTIGIEPIVLENKAPPILTVQQVVSLLTVCRSAQPTMLSYFTLAIFCGVRPQEIFRLTWDEVQIERGFVEIKAAKAKNRQRRLIEIQPNCAAWLKLSKELGGKLPPINWQDRYVDVRVAAKIDWNQGSMRHSFCSYALPVFGASKTAQWAGHSEDMLFRHYRELVTVEDANRFWAIVP
jgi:integrase